MEANKVVHITLVASLGGSGVHKFYAGETMSGFLYLLSCWAGILHIIAIISATLISLRPADENGNVTMQPVNTKRVTPRS